MPFTLMKRIGLCYVILNTEQFVKTLLQYHGILYSLICFDPLSENITPFIKSK